MKFPKNNLQFIGAAGCLTALVFAIGCGNAPQSDDHGHDHGDADAHSHETSQAPPHGGTPVLISADAFHLELVLDAANAELQAHVLDGHMESYVPVTETAFAILATVDGEQRRLDFEREATTTDAAAPSSLFVAGADWLTSTKTFSGRIPTISLNGQVFNDVAFEFPEGSSHTH